MTTRTLNTLLYRALSGAPLVFDEALLLLEAPAECHGEIVAAANAMRRQMHGNQATYVINRNMCFTNICYVGCNFCNFAVGLNDGEAFNLNQEEARKKLTERSDFTEVCMQGGIHPKMALEDYLRLLDWVREIQPEIHIHAFSAEEIHHIAIKSGKSIEATLALMQERGLNSMPGTAAEIFHPAIRRHLCPEKILAERWFEIHRAAHGLGIPSTATMLFGHIEQPVHIIDHIFRILDLQAETGGFTEFVPLLFIHPLTSMRDWEGMHQRPEERQRYIERVYAVSRLALGERIAHLQTSWVKLGVQRAIETLDMGCDDFGGSLYEERITKTAGGTSGDRIDPEVIIQTLQEAGFAPLQRTTTYQILN